MSFFDIFKEKKQEPGLTKFLVDKKTLLLPTIFVRVTELNRKISKNWYGSVYKKDRETNFDELQLILYKKARDISAPKFTGSNPENRFISYNCHTYFLLALGFNLSLKQIKGLTTEKHIMPNFFGSPDYCFYSTKEDIKRQLEEKFLNTKSCILGCQFLGLDRKFVGHSLFAVKSGNEIYLYDKGGYGMVDSYGTKFDDYFNEGILKDMKKEWGQLFACDSWAKLAQNEEVKKQVAEFNSQK